MKNLIQTSINHRIWVILLFVLIAFSAVFSLKNARIDAIPDVGENQQIVFTAWDGRSPKDIEEQITYPLSALMQGLGGIKEVRATSAFGFSMLYIIFNDDVDFYWSRSRVLEKLASANAVLPDGVNPVLGAEATGLGQVFWYTVEDGNTSLGELRTIQDWYIKYRLQAVDGVAEVASVGGFVKEYQIDVDPIQLFARNLHFSALINAIKNSNIDVGAKVIEQGGREIAIRGLGFFRSIEDIENVVIDTKNGIPILVKDVAKVHIGAAFRRGSLNKNGQETVGGVVTMRYGENPKIVIDKVKAKIAEISNGLPEGVKIIPFYDRTEITDKTIDTVYNALSQEIIITVLVILLFLWHLPSGILVSLTLPFGVGISFILMYLFGIDSNVMSLSGLVIAIGTMVDMGIIMTENIYSSLAKNTPTPALPPEGVGRDWRIAAITEAAKEVGKPIFIAVLTTIITFLPVFALEGAEGKLFTPLAWAKTLALFGSLIVAVVLIPALAPYFLKGHLKTRKSILSTIYKPVLTWLLNHKALFSIIPIFTIALGIYGYNQIGKEFMPSLNEGDILYMPTTTPDVSITKANELLAYTNKIITTHPLVEYAVGKVGRADTALDPAPISMIETVIKLKPLPDGVSEYHIMKELDEMVQITGLINSWNFPIQTRIGMVSTGIKTQIGIKIFGDDLKTLENLASQIAKKVGEVEGAYGIYAEKIVGKPYLEFDIDRLKASRYGINTGDINNIIQTAIGGMSLGQVYKGRERYAVRVRYKKELRNKVDELKRVLVPSPLGQHIPLNQLADIRITTGEAVIQSENGLLRSLVLLNVRDRDLVGFVDEAKQVIFDNVTLPNGYSIEWAGQYENQARASKRLALIIPIALLINLFILYFGFKSFKESMIILTAIPVAMSGGMLLLWLGEFNLSVAVWVGFIALFGIVIDDGVVMMTYIKEELAKHKPENSHDIKEAIINAGCRRIRPLIMTTITTILALLPVMWATTTGSEIMKPMAIPILGGMMIELVSLFIVPVVFSIVEERKCLSPTLP